MRCWLLLALSACGFESVQNITGGDLAGADFSAVDFAVAQDLSVPPGSDLSLPPGSDLSLRPGADLAKVPCNPPLLLVAVEDLTNDAQSSGHVAALSLGDGNSPPAQCKVFHAQGFMTAQPQSVAMVAGQLAVEGVDEVQLIDAQSDTVLWSKAAGTTDVAADVFALDNPAGGTVVAATWGFSGTSAPWPIRRIDAWGLDGSAVRSWNLGTADIPLGLSIIGMTSNPSSTTHLLANDPNNNEWGWDVDPWSASKTGLVGNAASGTPISIYADTWMGNRRIAWLDASGSTAVVYHNDPNSGLFGPIACSGCSLVHVVPDPTLNTRFLGLCDGPTVDARRVVRFESTGGTCDTVFDGASFGALSRFSRLGISQ